MTRFVLTTVLAASTGHAKTTASPGIRSLLPAKSTNAEVLQMVPTAEARRLTTRLSAAMKKHAKWARAYVAKHGDAAPLPYHPNLGLSAKEYKKLQQLITSKQGLRLSKAATVQLLVKREREGLTLKADKLPFFRHGIHFDLKRRWISVTGAFSINQPPQDDSGVRKQSGSVYLWRTDNLSKRDRQRISQKTELKQVRGAWVQVSLSKAPKDSHCLLSVEVTQLDRGHKNQQEAYLRYPCSGS